MNLAEILTSALYLTDAHGNRKAIQLELAVWQEILIQLESAEAERTSQTSAATKGTYRSVSTSSEDAAQRKQDKIE